jgi:hypothetical protein
MAIFFGYHYHMITKYASEHKFVYVIRLTKKLTLDKLFFWLALYKKECVFQVDIFWDTMILLVYLLLLRGSMIWINVQ